MSLRIILCSTGFYEQYDIKVKFNNVEIPKGKVLLLSELRMGLTMTGLGKWQIYYNGLQKGTRGKTSLCSRLL